jgi:sterol desaturase/sphingolipid hydroxylase (fatty acid hydroxylase superfamily)
MGQIQTHAAQQNARATRSLATTVAIGSIDQVRIEDATAGRRDWGSAPVRPYHRPPISGGHMELIGSLLAEAAEALLTVLPSAIGFAIAFTVLTLFSSQACNPGRPWWRNPELGTDICYILIIPFIAPYINLSLLILGTALLSGVLSEEEIADYFENGRGPLAVMPFWAQVPFYIVVSDFMLYWSHRIFHGAHMWRFHAIHHSAEEVDWTTAFRFHPVNLWLGQFLLTTVMLFLGISPTVLLFLAPLDITSGAFIHANLNWTLGPFKYVFVTPVFHRWHHTPLEQGGNTNFGGLLSIWDVLFGTFYMPAHALPATYGIGDAKFPKGFIGQTIHPFRDLIKSATSERAHPPAFDL